MSDGSVVEYLNGAGIDDKLRQRSSSAPTTPHYFLTDHLGSTTALTDASGAVVERQSYEAFGASAGSSLTRYGYTGRERDGETGLLYYRARWYDAQQGRFLSEDPIGFASGDTNLYAYVGNNPLSYRDPSGRFAWAAVWAFVEFGLTVADAIALVTTLADDCVATGDKLKALFWFGVGAIAPLGGWAAWGRWGGKLKQIGGKGWRWAKRTLGFGDEAAQVGDNLFHNTMPEKLAAELSQAEAFGAKALRVGDAGFDEAVNSGTIKWIVSAEGDLIIMPKWVNGTEISHSFLSKGGAVRAAGEAEVFGNNGQYFLGTINNHSGHYLPSANSINVGINAFLKSGFTNLQK